MAVDIVIPSVGESVASGVLARWVVADGASVARDDIVAELETDKVTLEVRAPEAGTLRHRAKQGDTVNVGAIVAVVEAGAAAPKAAPAPPESAPAAAGPKTSPAKASAAPVLTERSAPVSIPAGAGSSGAGSAGGEPGHDADHEGNGQVRATPLARKLATEHDVDLAAIVGTGAGQRVREQDVLAFVQSRPRAAPPSPSAPATAPLSAAAPSVPRTGAARERMSPLRQRIAARLVEAQHTAAMLTTFNEVDMTAVMALRKQYKEDFEKRHAVGLGFMGFFVKAVVGALKAFPLVNASIVTDESGALAIERHPTHDIAVAVSTPKGLVVPVLRDCEALSFAGIESGIKALAARARDGKLTLDEMQGGTFTITNGGVFGSLMSTPILNPPQAAILGMHTIKNRAVEDPANPGHIALRPMMYLAVSYDHRLIDGAEAVQFLVRIKQAIEDPQRLLLEV